MGKILDYIQNQGNGKYFCYKTKKFMIDTNSLDTFSYDDKNIFLSSSSKIAETDLSKVHSILIPQNYILNCTPIFSYFLDGSRRVYKVDDIAVGKKIFPVLAGQIIVGCCERKDRDTFKGVKINNRLVLSMPDDFDIDDENNNNNFCRLYCERINQELSNIPFFNEKGIVLDEMLLYKTDGFENKDSDKEKYINRATSKIQSAMMDEEQLLVMELCKNNKLDDSHFLIKDGSLEYNPRFSNMEKSDWEIMRVNYKHVVGVSKLFNPELLLDFDGNNLSRTIANLKPFERTKVYRYPSEHTGSEFAVWYLRLRHSEFRETNYSDVVKCEMVIENEGDTIETSLIDLISANLIKEAYPVCYGKDTRWANHLYPIYLTESFCKSHYIDSNIIYKLF